MPPESPPTPSELRRGRLWALAAALCWSSGGFFAKAPAFLDWPGPALACWRAVFACLVLVPSARRPEWSWKLLPMTLAFAAMNFTYLSALERCEATSVIWLQSTAPGWVLLWGVLVWRERATPRDYAMLGCQALGMSLILGFQLQGESAVGVGLAVLSGMLYAFVVLSLRSLRRFSPTWLSAVNHLAAAVFLAPFAWHAGVAPSGWQWLLLLGFGVGQLGLPYVFFGRALRTIPGHEATGIALLEPILLPLWVYLAWGSHPSYEPPAATTLLGGGLILAGLAARYLIAPRSGENGKMTKERIKDE